MVAARVGEARRVPATRADEDQRDGSSAKDESQNASFPHDANLPWTRVSSQRRFLRGESLASAFRNQNRPGWPGCCCRRAGCPTSGLASGAASAAHSQAGRAERRPWPRRRWCYLRANRPGASRQRPAADRKSDRAQRPISGHSDRRGSASRAVSRGRPRRNTSNWSVRPRRIWSAQEACGPEFHSPSSLLASVTMARRADLVAETESDVAVLVVSVAVEPGGDGIYLEVFRVGGMIGRPADGQSAGERRQNGQTDGGRAICSGR